MQWTGKERPAGYIAFSGANVVDSYKEILASLDDIPIYRQAVKDPELGPKYATRKRDLYNEWASLGTDVERAEGVISLSSFWHRYAGEPHERASLCQIA